jgi:dTDP-4-amino-4,6-dideoxygalactose transaminase
MTCGEGGAVVTSDADAARRAECFVDPCMFYWTGRRLDFKPFAAVGARASEFEGAMMNAQLDRLPGMIRIQRRHKKRLLKLTAGCGLTDAPCHDLDGECGNNVLYSLPSADAAAKFAKLVGGTVTGRTGRHTYNEWDIILNRSGSHHPALDPFRMPQNRRCRSRYSLDMCRRSLDILNRTVMVGLHPDRTDGQIAKLAGRIRKAAEQALRVR